MFGKKKKLAQQQAEQQLAQEQVVQLQEATPQAPVFFDSEIIDDNEVLPAELWEELEELAENAVVNEEEAAQLQAIEDAFDVEQAPESVEEEVEEIEEIEEVEQSTDDEQIEEVEEPAQENAEEEAEETVYIVEGPEEDDEIVEPSKFVKLPHLIDFIVKQNYSKAMLLKMTTMIMGVYKRPSNTTEDKHIIKQCLIKLAMELQKK